MPKWIEVTDGTLALEGTPMQIIYRLGPGGAYRIYVGGHYRWPCMTLACAKSEAEHIYRELSEIGAV